MDIPEIPEKIWRHPTRDAINSLASRFDLVNLPDMQDWQWEVADPARAEEFVTAYETAGLDDDEKFTLMEVIIQSCEDRHNALEDDRAWPRVLRLIEQNIDLHIATVWYWACAQCDIADAWRVTPFMREILARHIERFLRQCQSDTSEPTRFPGR